MPKTERKETCIYCGRNPVPHRLYWYNESLNILLTPFRQKLLYNPLTRLFKERGWGVSTAAFFLRLGEALNIITRQKNPAACKIRRAQVLWEEAGKRGVVMEELLFLGKPFDCYVASKEVGSKNYELGENQTRIFSGLPRPGGYINNKLDLMDDKAWFKKTIMENALPVAKGGSCSNLADAKRIFGKIDKPVIVKPRAGSRGRHSTTFISTEADLKAAFKVAQQLCHWVMVEQQLIGPVYRATVINFELAGVLRGDSPQVKGDGGHSIADLVKIKNAAAHTGVKDIVTEVQTELFLSRQNLAMESIPKKDEVISLSEKIGVNYGGSSSEDFDVCHPDNKELFTNAAKVLGDPIVGFDFIIPDITESWKNQKCGFIEVNTLPFINLHHDPLRGQPRNVAGKIWEMVGW